jgi:hypothetical protein
MSPPEPKGSPVQPTIVLVHGAFAESSSAAHSYGG